MSQVVDLMAPAGTELPSAGIGRKAATLHRLSAAGLPVPKAVALPFQLVKEIVVGHPDALATCRRAATELGFPLVVRSSASMEDTGSGAAPGLFESVVDVHDWDQLFKAVCHVHDSGRTPLVEAYRRTRGITEAPDVAVILQRHIDSANCEGLGSGTGVIYTRPPGQPQSTVAILEGSGKRPVWIDRESGQLQPKAKSQEATKRGVALWELAARVEAVLGCRTGVDVEWVWSDEGPWIVQARPIVHRRDLDLGDTPDIRALIAFSRGDLDTIWRLDATHNPFPLSPAQAGLVHVVKDIAPYRMRVVGGYLYTAPKADVSASSPLGRDELDALFRERYLPKMESFLQPVEALETIELNRALEAYQQVFRCYTDELAPAIAAAGDEDEGANPLSRWLARARRGELTVDELMQSVSPMSPAWDVSVPTYGESPELVERALRKQGRDDAPVGDRDSLREADDLLFYRAQYLVRRALLQLGRSWQVGDSIFYMPLERLREEGPSAPPDVGSLLARAQGAREAKEEQRGREMPLAFSNGQALPSRLPPNAEVWRGIGTGAYATGTVVRVARMGEIPAFGDGTVLVMPTVTPAHALAAVGAVAVICEYGDHLGHGAAMARELGIPCIVGCRRAWRELRTGDQVAVHGAAGLVARLAEGQEY